MNRIIAKRSVSEDVVKFEIKTPVALKDIKPGQYIILRNAENDHGICVPVLKTDKERETISVVVVANDDRARQLVLLNAGSEVSGVEGPFGQAVQTGNYGTVLCIGRKQGIVALLPVLTSLHAAGNRIVTVLSAPDKDGIILENEIQTISDEVIILTDDGSRGEKGQICHAMVKELKSSRFDQVFVFGPAKAIKETCSVATKYNIPVQAFLYLDKTIASHEHTIFNVSLCGNAKAVCVDGFNFNAWYPNLDDMVQRFESAEPGHSAKINVSDGSVVTH